MRVIILGFMAAAIAVAQAPLITGIENAGSEITAGLPNSGIAQGSIFIVTGTNLGPAMLQTSTAPFQNIGLAGTSVAVEVNGLTENALMYYTSATQVAALLPSATPTGNGVVTVTYTGTSQAFPVTVVPNNLGIFTITSDGKGAAIITYPSGSLVSVEPAVNCGAVDTTCGAANPNDTLVLWATGLGPISGNDASGAGLGVAMPNIPLKIWVGGVQATVEYQGRTPCCIGEDQINFVVPLNAPVGCAVPLAVQIGNEISNYTVIPIAPVGTRTCSATNPVFTPAVVGELTTPVGSINYGTIALEHLQGSSGNTDTLNAQFQRISVPVTYQPFIASYADLPASGTCMVYNTLNGAPNPPFALLADLDTGPSISITGPNGTQMAINMNENYQATISANGSFLAPGNYTITSTGSLNIGPLNASLTIPALPVLNMPASNTITRANGFTVTWSGGSATEIVTITGQSATDATNTIGASFKCSTQASAGSITIPAAVLLALPAGSNASWNFMPGIPPVGVSATGLNIGVLSATYDTPIAVTLQ